MTYLAPFPDSQKLKKLYSASYFKRDVSYSGYSDYLKMEPGLRKEATRKLIFIEKFVHPPATLLDVGAGLGFFASQARERNFQVTALDLSPFAADYIRKKYGIKSLVANIGKPADLRERYQLVTGWDVFEHIPNPKEAFRTINSVLVDNGWLFLTTPNIESIDAKILRSHWYGFKKIPEHLQFFSPQTISQFAKEAGFKVIEIKTWGFVRDFGFIAEKAKLYNKLIGQLLERFFTVTKLEGKNIYLPFIDMMVILQKEKDAE